LAKGPLSVILTGLVAGTFALVERRWGVIRKFSFHPGVIMMIVLASAWYVIAVTRGGEGFFDRQILEENLSRFVGGSGHSRPVYYYVPYLFAKTLPWGFFLPLLLWDLFRKGFHEGGDALFLKLWLLAMFVFFSVSVGKRPVYLLPLYPAVALLLAAWFYAPSNPGRGRLAIYRCFGAFAALTGGLLLVITLGALWSHDPGWFFAPIEGFLRPKDRANVMAVRNHLDDFGWIFTLLSLCAAALWLSMVRFLWHGRMRAVAHHLVAITLIHVTIGFSLVMPVIAQGKSYRDFMSEVNRRVKPEEKLYIHGDFNDDTVVFYRGGAIERLAEPLEALAPKLGRGDAFIIMPARPTAAGLLPPPVLKSEGSGPERDAPLVLMQGDLP
jgi:4-amino-4-deoxy-L-arabinose transferase-like glycosyltransferase